MHPSNIVVSAGGMHALGLVFRDGVARGYRKAICQAPVFRGVHDAMLAAGLAVETVTLTGSAEDWDVLAPMCREPTGQAPVFRGVHDAMLAAGLAVETVTLTGSAEDWDVLAPMCREPT
ncbi:hypothetical protein AB4Z54_74035, partial [Streptomyces sp. MCAF7]